MARMPKPLQDHQMKRFQLDNQRNVTMEALYERSGRTCGTYTGLWQEYAADIATNFRDTDYQELYDSVCLAMGETKSVLIEKHAQQAIEVCRQYLLGKWV
jgi:hypothetical protein